jgi:nitroreductase
MDHEMCRFDEKTNESLDGVVAARRTNRVFLPDVPPRDRILGIIQAGLAAPFAAAAIGGPGDEYFRQFFVFSRESRGLAAVSGLMLGSIRSMADQLVLDTAGSNQPMEKGSFFARRLEAILKTGIVPGVGTAPYYIVVAERKGFPPVEAQSLAHCLENMWLKATALNLGFQLVSVTGRMGDDPEFCRILGIRPGVYELNGCAIGYPREQLPPSTRPPAEEVTHWVE